MKKEVSVEVHSLRQTTVAIIKQKKKKLRGKVSAMAHLLRLTTVASTKKKSQCSSSFTAPDYCSYSSPLLL